MDQESPYVAAAYQCVRLPPASAGVPARAGARLLGGCVLRRLVRIDLPRRLARTLPSPLTELIVGLAIGAAFAMARAALFHLLDSRTPFALAFLAVVLATLVAGWRSGLVAMVTGQGLIWYFLVPYRGSFAIATASDGWGLGLTTATQAAILFALHLYQREVKAGELERQRRINFLGHALGEIDHRTRNNFQIVTAMLQLQAGRAGSEEVRAALGEAAERLQAVSAVYAALTPSSQGLAAIRLHDQLEEICAQIRRGILPEGIALEAELEPLLVPNETAVAIGIIVNELVTNACKHAFGDDGGTIFVRCRKDNGGAVIEVEDDGRGFAPEEARNGLGSRLVAAFVRRVKGRSELASSPEGTRHVIRVPLG
jgi:two-component sensor histidine kinase